MENNKISENIKSFIYKYVTSLEQLEVLFFLYNNKNNQYNALMINQEIKTNTVSIESKLQDLFNKNFLILKDNTEKMYQYSPKDDKLSYLVSEIHQFYKNNYHIIVSLIYSKPLDNISSFADSFI